MTKQAYTPTPLQLRAARALDLTHAIGERGPRTMKCRSYLAAWLDGRKIRVSMIRYAINYLQMIARTCQ